MGIDTAPSPPAAAAGDLATGRIISADDHMDMDGLPAGVFVDRVDPAMRDRVPIVRDTDEGPWWHIEGRPFRPSGRKLSAPSGMVPVGHRPGIPEQRLEDMDVDTVHAQVIYGPLRGFSVVPDLDARTACHRAYNDWMREFCAVAPDRLVGLGWVPAHDIGAATEELGRIAGLGLRGVLVNPFETGVPVFDEAWEPFWAAAGSAGIPVHLHIGAGTHSIADRHRSWRRAAFAAVLPLQLDEFLAGLLLCGVFERHPRLRVVLGESGLGWVPYVLERVDHEWHKYGPTCDDHRVAAPPSQAFREHVYVTYEEDGVGVAQLDRIGAGNVMWASDYPHGDSTWPNSRRAIAESVLARIDAASRRRIVHDNAAALYRIG